MIQISWPEKTGELILKKKVDQTDKDVIHVVITRDKLVLKVGTNKRTTPTGPRQMVSCFKVILWAIFRSLASSYHECFACSAFIHNLVTFQCSCTEMMNVHVWQMWKQNATKWQWMLNEWMTDPLVFVPFSPAVVELFGLDPQISPQECFVGP